MTRKRFFKLVMSQTSQKVAVFATNHVLQNMNHYGSYQQAWDRFYGDFTGRFEIYVQSKRERKASF